MATFAIYQFTHQIVAKQSLIRRLIATFANLSPDVCQTISKQSPFHRRVISEFANYSPIIAFFCHPIVAN